MAYYYEKPTLTALEAAEKIRSGQMSSAEAVQTCQAHIERTERTVHAFITRDTDSALLSAARSSADQSGDLAAGLLDGVPMGLKDNICTLEMPTTCGSRMLAGYRPPYEATAWKRLRDKGAILMGKLNMDEFAMGGTSETSWFGTVRNPIDPQRIAGGSSGGSAAAVAAGSVLYALGSDTGGSVRQPAAYCGVTGMKPTYGAVSRYGLVAYASSLDQIGPIAADALSCAAALAEITGPDGFDSNARRDPPVQVDQVREFSLAGLRIGLPEALFGDGLEAVVRTLVLDAARDLERAGAIVEPVRLAGTDLAIPAYYVIACAEASSNLSRYDGVKYGYRPDGAEDLIDLYARSRTEGFGDEVKRRLLLGNFVLSSGFYDAYYKRAVKAREQISRNLDQLFERVDLLLCPTTPDTAPLLGASAGDPLTLYLKDLYTVIPNLAGLPAISVPCGWSGGLPVGMQLIGRRADDQRVLGAAHAFQQVTNHHRSTAARQDFKSGIDSRLSNTVKKGGVQP